MTQSGPFVINDLPHGWSVTWPGYEHVVVNNFKKLDRLLGMLFDDIRLDRAQLGILLNNQDFEVYHIDSVLWFDIKARKHLIEHIMGMYTICGAKFDHERDARQFLGMLEQRYIWAKLGGAWS